MLALTASAPGTVYSLSGVFPGGTAGAGVSIRCQVTPGGAMAVTVYGGQYQVDRGALGVFIGAVTASVTVPIAAPNPTNPRIDYVVIRTRDPGIDDNVTESAKIIILQGDPSPVPDEPVDQLTSGDLLLAAVVVRVGASSILASDIADRRRFVVARGGITPYSAAQGTPTPAYAGQYFDNLDTLALERWNGTELIPVATGTGWREFTPKLYAGGDGVVSGTTECWLGTGAEYFGRYQVVGKRCDLTVVIRAGSAPLNMGVGIINSLLPEGLLARASSSTWPAQQWYANLYTQNGDDWPGQAGVRDNTNVISLAFPINRNTPRIQSYIVATQQGVPGGGTPLIEGGFPDPLILAFHGFLEIQ